MIPPVAAILIGAGAVLVFDSVGSLAARRWGFDYSRLAPGSFLIYFAVGFAAARPDSPAGAAAAGAIVAFVEATIGWAISWFIGPGRLPDRDATTARVVNAVGVVTSTGAFFGLIGGAAWWLLLGRHSG